MEDNEKKPTTKEFAANDQANYYSGITSIKVNGKNAYELKGKFLDDLHNNAFSRTNRENAVEHIKCFLRIVDPIDLLNVNQDKLRVFIFPISLVGDAWKWFDEIKGSINRMNSMMSSKNLGMKMVYLMKLGIIFANLFVSKMGELNEDGFYNGGELPGMVRVGYMAYFQDHEWYNDLMDGSSKDEALEQKDIYEESWGDAKQSVINFCKWLRKTFRNFHELDYGLLEKLQDYWWKVNEHECSPFANWKNYIRGPYVNYYSNFLDVMEHEEEERCEVFDNHERPVCYIRIFEMVKYSFRDNKGYVAIKENEYDDLTNTSKDAIHAYQEIFRMMDEKWMVTRNE
ncbi:hypothetical protein Tco_1356180 [Tanacetum coccineum]